MVLVLAAAALSFIAAFLGTALAIVLVGEWWPLLALIAIGMLLRTNRKQAKVGLRRREPNEDE